jgi:hypothetical protein
VHEKSFPAYQESIVAYTVAMLAWETHGVIDFDLLWSRQTISPELGVLIDHCAGQIDRALRFTAEKQMPSEWAKRSECWDRICEIELDIQSQIPPELRETPADANAEPEMPRANGGDKSVSTRDELICSLRRVFRGSEVRSREEVGAALRTFVVNPSPDDQVGEELDSVIRTALRRNILESRGDKLALGARSIIDYKRDFLEDQFVASMLGRSWVERDEGVLRFSIWLGFRRASSFIDGAARSVINGLLRDGRLEARGSLIRRTR